MRELGVGQLRPDVAARHSAEAKEKSKVNKPRARRNRHAPKSTPALLRNKERAMHFENKLLRLGMELNSGERYYTVDVRKEGFTLGNAIRAEIERLIDQTAPQLAIERDSAERRRLLVKEVRRVRRVIKQAFPRALRKIRAAARATKP
jgi:DNA-directed RNA polymerase subunit L